MNLLTLDMILEMAELRYAQKNAAEEKNRDTVI